MHESDEATLVKLTGQKALSEPLKAIYARCQKRYHQIHNGSFSVETLVLMCEMAGCGVEPSEDEVTEPADSLVLADGQVNWAAQPAGVLIRFGRKTGKLMGAPDVDELGTLRIQFDSGEEDWRIPAAKCSLLGPLELPKPGNAKLDFDKGTRVRASTKKHGMREGTVEGIAGDGKVKVLFDGNKSTACIKPENVEKLEPELAK